MLRCRDVSSGVDVVLCCAMPRSLLLLPLIRMLLCTQCHLYCAVQQHTVTHHTIVQFMSGFSNLHPDLVRLGRAMRA